MSTVATPSLSAEAFAPDAVLAYWDGRGDETAERVIARGTGAIGDAVARWGRLETLVAVREGDDCFIEARLDGGDPATLVASLQLDDSGLIARCLAFRSPPVEPPPAGSAAVALPAGSAHDVLTRYFAKLTAAEFGDAVACFSDDCLYSHPPYSSGGERVEFRGRAELLAGFQEVRGARPQRLPQIVRCVQNGAHCFIEGVVDGDPPRGSFVSSAALDADGLISRYVAFYTESRVPRL